MIQIGIQPPLALVADAPSRGPDQEIGPHFGAESLLDPCPPGEAGDGSVFVSPPPLPFPRVFPGL